MTRGTLPSVSTYIRELARRTGPGGRGLTDAELLDRFVTAGEEPAFETLVWRHGSMVLGVCRRHTAREQDAEDAFQATFLALARKAAKIHRKDALAGWLYRVALRAARAAGEKSGRYEPLSDAIIGGLTARSEAVSHNDVTPIVDEEVSRLPERYRIPFILCCLEGKTVDEAAAELGAPRGTIGSAVSRAKDRLRVRLARRGLALPAAALATAVPATAAGATPPAALVRETAHAAALGATGRVLPVGLLPPNVPIITRKVLASMCATKLKCVAACVAVLASFTGLLTHHVLAAGPDAIVVGAGDVPGDAPSFVRAMTPVQADEPKPFTVTVRIRGVVNENDAEALRAALKKVPAVKVDPDHINPGEKGTFGHYFSPSFVIEFTDPSKTDLGAVAKAIAATKTSKRGDLPPSLNLVLFAGKGKIEESDGSIPAVREALGDLNGVEARATGGTVGNLADATVSVRLDDSGNATLADILAALKRADLDFRTEKP